MTAGVLRPFGRLEQVCPAYAG